MNFFSLFFHFRLNILQLEIKNFFGMVTYIYDNEKNIKIFVHVIRMKN
jgi:hypothetical protein